MKTFFKEAVRINLIENPEAREAGAKELFLRLNDLAMPERFNWAADVFEELWVHEHPEKIALIWTDLDTLETKTYTYLQLLQQANRLINFFRKAGIQKGENLYMMSPVLPENWFVTLACIKAGLCPDRHHHDPAGA